MKIYTVSTMSKIDYDFSVEVIKHGAFASFESAHEQWERAVAEFKYDHWRDIDKYSNKEIYQDEEFGALYMETDDEHGYFCCNFGFEQDFESHQICIDEWDLDN